MGKGKEKIQWKNQLVSLVAIIIGVYIAFYLSERASAAKDRNQAKAFLVAMADDLQEDISNLTESTDTLRYYTQVSRALTQSVISRRIPKDSLNAMINSLYLIVPFNPKDNAYQSLLASGKLELVGDFELRSKITALYHQHYGAIRITDDISNQTRLQLITPFLIERLRFTPKGLANAEELWQDNMFVNIAFSMQYSMQMKYQVDSVALVHAKELKQLIEKELE
ncbi:MAG: hypothetical protein L6Q51_11710 [Cyclobacteriaceae bacterium]|nr:hypothetical protein [Cyclobacteriaceae bacterium]